MGPTASGKTQLAVKLTQHFPMEIVSVDSAMVYRTMDIGTAKPDEATLKLAPHRLINIRDPKEPYSAAQFREDALREIQDIFQQKKIPLLVGGTMLYFRVLQEGLSDLPSANAVVRKKIMKQAEDLGWPAMHARLVKIDPLAGARIHPHDSQRIQRALEVYELTGKSLSEWTAEKTSKDNFHFYNLAIAPNDRAILHARIAERFKQMLNEGLIEEVRRLRSRGDLSLEMPSIRSVGYRQVWEYLAGNYSYQEMEERGIIATRQLAKRQLTWLRSWPDVRWFDSEAGDLYEQVERYIIQRILLLSSKYNEKA
ncbi:MAG TPA: tRNA (adenosine(37)-N6)-dimethylallyltransferase MiaA [Gammaproteobacteria bacterium]|nr:tRNA (adenosine(37)-N6)-dimethylallyltransferase MiaA [Gammaproteobacteria bacterium]